MEVEQQPVELSNDLDYSDISSDCSVDDLVDKYEDVELDKASYYEEKVRFQKYEGHVNFSQKSARQKDKGDRATTDHALDRRTLGILFKMMSQGFLEEINGCISTGKEANVYHSTKEGSPDMAIKVYMTSIMPFKDRDKYVSGDFRMRRGYCKHNSWKLVTKWAEKEYRNLLRIYQAGTIPCPKPLKLKGVVLVMSFIGHETEAAPKLKDAPIDSLEEWECLYRQLVLNMRTLFQDCRLVHADLSEYNLLYLDSKIWMIDVSQSVEHEHPKALDFLRNDCHNITVFFRRQGVPGVLTLRELFEFIVDPTIGSAFEVALARIMSKAEGRGEEAFDDDAAFKDVFIPRNLQQVPHFVRDFARIRRQQMSTNEVYYASVTGIKPDLTGIKEAEPSHTPEICSDSASKESNSSDSEGSNADGEESSIHDGSEQPARKVSSRRPRHESPDSKKERKRLVKGAQQEKRRVKMPKHEKKRKESKSKH